MTQGLLIYVAANPMAGTSRLLRSLSLARQWVIEGGHVTFVTSDVPGLLLRKIAIAGCSARYVSLPSHKPEFAALLCDLARRDGCDWIVTDDHCQTLIENLHKNKLQGQRQVLLGRSNRIQADLQTACSPAFALIRNNVSIQGPWRLNRNKRNKRCLIDLSRLEGVDDTCFLEQVFRRFKGTGTVFDVVTPLASTLAERIKNCKTLADEYVYWHRNTDRVYQSLFAFDVALLSDYSDFYELAWAGIASFLAVNEQPVELIGLQNVTKEPWLVGINSYGLKSGPNANGFHPDGKTDGDIKNEPNRWQDRLCDLLERQIASPTRLARHQQEMRRLVDDQGAIRLSRQLKAITVGQERIRTA